MRRNIQKAKEELLLLPSENFDMQPMLSTSSVMSVLIIFHLSSLKRHFLIKLMFFHPVIVVSILSVT